MFKGSGLSVLEAWLPAPDWTLTCDVTIVKGSGVSVFKGSGLSVLKA